MLKYLDLISPLYRHIPNKKDLSVKEKSLLVTPAGFEPAIFWMRTRYPGPLDDGAMVFYSRHIVSYLLASVQEQQNR